ncbi:hypothetical protein DUI87_25370 [Hirundo rustica rustica]|uniref:Uncharacterized protein n=1 Tax=Hirundo rustica rustica TaxID=333673 RepID=A0A3M0JAE3_HIRRU|nr:hypothetical protein DUI87_25370 [Hirundo rustica rustica]
MEILLIPHTLQGFGTPQMNFLDMQNTVLRQLWELGTGNRHPHLPITPGKCFLAIQVLLPWHRRNKDPAMDPPPGYAIQLELDTAGMSQRNFCVRVELLCTCTREQLGQDMLCCLQHPEEELRRKQEPSLLHTLCTGSCLDVEATARWFCRFVRIAWLLLPQSYRWHLMLHPSSHSCKFQLSKDKESFMAETISGVRQGDSDIFVESQLIEAGMLSTMWPETYAVAEAKFFRPISRQPPRTAGTASACSSSAAPAWV